MTTLARKLRLIERKIRASVPVDRHEDARHARYFLSDPFLQFYYRFVASNRSKIALGLADELKRIFVEQLRGYVGLAFEQLCRRWNPAHSTGRSGTLGGELRRVEMPELRFHKLPSSGVPSIKC